MQNKAYIILLTVLLLINGHIAIADPWFTGPLIALSGQALAPEDSNIEFYSSYTTINNIYNRNWGKEGISEATITQFFPSLSHGLINNIDIEVDPTYVINHTKDKTSNNMGDTTVILGFQLLDKGKDFVHPYLRLTLQETFPTGLYDQLNPTYLGTDATGLGSYQTGLGLNFEYLAQLTETNYLNTHLCVTYVYAASVPLNGFSVYGGSPTTKGRIAPGNIVSIDAAGEISLTQNWVAVIEGIFSYQQASSFTGSVGKPPSIPTDITDPKRRRRFLINRLIPSRHNIGGRQNIGGGNNDQFTLTPAIEYNFSANYGIIGGVTFNVAGKNTVSPTTATLAFNAAW